MDKTKKPASELKNISWTKCFEYCLAVEYLGVGECKNVCPDKFKKDNTK